MNDLPAQLFQQLGMAAALADADSMAILVENGRFFQYFPSSGAADETLTTRMPALDIEKARNRMAADRPFTQELEVRSGVRTVNVMVEIRKTGIDGRDRLIVECRDITKQKEAEYMLDSYSRIAERNARELQREKERVEKLLLNIMPKSVYQELKEFGTTTPHKFDSASVLMLDFVGFTDMAVSRDPASTVAELNDIFTALDRIAELFGCERIKTMGDAYMAVSGVPETNIDHPNNIAKLALRARRYLERRNLAHPNQWRCRIGIHTGALIGSLVGVQKYVYDVFGPAVNMAARLEQQADPMQILLTEATAALIANDFRVSPVGEVDLQGFGHQRLVSLEEERRG